MNTLNVVGKAGNTFEKVTTDTAQGLDAMDFKDSKDRLITSLFIQIQAATISFCFGSTPVQGGLGMLLKIGETLYLKNPANIRSFNFISNASGTPATMTITPFYGNY